MWLRGGNHWSFPFVLVPPGWQSMYLPVSFFNRHGSPLCSQSLHLLCRLFARSAWVQCFPTIDLDLDPSTIHTRCFGWAALTQGDSSLQEARPALGAAAVDATWKRMHPGVGTISSANEFHKHRPSLHRFGAVFPWWAEAMSCHGWGLNLFCVGRGN